VAVDPYLQKLATQDINRALLVLQPLLSNQNWSDSDYHNYIIYTHGMKSVLANIGLSASAAMAGELEELGKRQDIDTILQKMPRFICELNVIAGQNHATTTIEADAPKGAPAIWQIQSKKLAYACRTYDKNAAKTALAVLAAFAWPCEEKNKISKAKELLLHSEFEAIELVLNSTKGDS